jgi:pilus assembly protein Flp/PilA
MLALLRAIWLDDTGATAIEYGLIAALIAVVLISTVRTVGTNLKTTFSTIGNAL